MSRSCSSSASIFLPRAGVLRLLPFAFRTHAPPTPAARTASRGFIRLRVADFCDQITFCRHFFHRFPPPRKPQRIPLYTLFQVQVVCEARYDRGTVALSWLKKNLDDRAPYPILTQNLRNVVFLLPKMIDLIGSYLYLQ